MEPETINLRDSQANVEKKQILTVPSVNIFRVSAMSGSNTIISLMLSATVPRRTHLYLRRLGLARRQGVAEQQCHQEQNQVVRRLQWKKE